MEVAERLGRDCQCETLSLALLIGLLCLNIDDPGSFCRIRGCSLSISLQTRAVLTNFAIANRQRRHSLPWIK
jgi:hypothetical protein